MTLIKISEDGLIGRAVNPYNNSFKKESGKDFLKRRDSSIDFEAANPSYPLTEPGEPNSEVEAELVWQAMFTDEKIGWYNIKKASDKYVNTRQAWQLTQPNSVSKEFLHTQPPTAEVTEQSIEEDISHLAGLPLSEIYLHGVIAGKDIRIKKLTSKVMAERDKVVELIETTAKEYAAEIDLDLLSKKGIEHNEIRIQLLTGLITKIKALKS